jgi:hypothetical protein
MGRLVNHNAPFPDLDAWVKQAFPKNALADRTGSSEEDDFHLVTSGAPTHGYCRAFVNDAGVALHYRQSKPRGRPAYQARDSRKKVSMR